MFKINDLKGVVTCCYGGGVHDTLYLDEYVEFADGYDKVVGISNSSINFFIGQFIEIDLDQAKLRQGRYIKDKEVRKIPQELALRRRMERVASADPTALAITREGVERVVKGEISEFEYKMVDNSNNTHHFIYRK